MGTWASSLPAAQRGGVERGPTPAATGAAVSPSLAPGAREKFQIQPAATAPHKFIGRGVQICVCLQYISRSDAVPFLC